MKLAPVATPNLTAAASGITAPVDQYEAMPVTTLTAAKTVLASESGSTFILALAAGFAVTLPSPERHLRYRFIVGVAPVSVANYTVSGSAMYGAVIAAASADAGVAIVNKASVGFTKDSAVIGDEFEVVSDGTKWFVRGSVTLAASITLPA